MADQKTLNTRISLKIDTWANWAKTDVAGQGGNLVLKKGEIAFVQVSNEMPPVSSTDTATELLTNPNTVLFKVGDGKTAFKDLKWGSALAADVHGWAKQDEEHFIEYLNTLIGNAVKDGDINLEGYVTDGEFDTFKTTLNTVTLKGITDAADGLTKRVEDIEKADYITIDDANEAATTKIEALVGKDKEAGVEGSTATGMFAEIDTLQAEVANINVVLDGLDDKYIDTDELNSAKTDLQGLINDKVAQDVYDEQVAELADKDEELAGLISTNAGEIAKINTLTPTLATKDEVSTAASETLDSAKEYTDDAIDTFYNTYIENDSKALDTLKDVTAWLDANKDGAADIVADITGLQNNKLNASDFNEFVTNDFTPVKTAVDKLDVEVLKDIGSGDVQNWDNTATNLTEHIGDATHLKDGDRAKIDAVPNKLDKADFDNHIAEAFGTDRTTVKEATHAASANNATSAESAGYATTAGSATTAGTAQQAIADEDGNNIAATYETKGVVDGINTRVKAIEEDATIVRTADYLLIDCGSSTVNID